MVTFLITSFFIIGFLAVAVYFWQKPLSTTETESLPPLEPRGLFAGGRADESALAAANAGAKPHAESRSSLIQRARQGDSKVLMELHDPGDAAFYNQALDLLVAKAGSDKEILSLASYVTRNELPVNRRLAEKFIDSWKRAPNRSSTAKMLHLGALSDDAAVYQAAVEAALQFWRAGHLSGVSAQELHAILEGEFWILSSSTRSSGTGFLLKRTLASARRELKAAQNEQ
jgi:hypothetical protein